MDAQLAQKYIFDLAKTLKTTIIQSEKLCGMMYVEYEPPMIEGPLTDQPN